MTGRLDPPFGTLVDRDRPLNFTFEDRPYSGFEGDTLASALAANGQWVLSRSFKYHRPRGALTWAGQDANTLVQLAADPDAHADDDAPADPNAPADLVPLREGLAARGQNVSGSLAADRDAWLGRLSAFLPVGFYYKAFFRPRGIWERWAPWFRRKAGLGVIDPASEPGQHDKQYRFCDVAVIGGGPAGLSAALAAADAGARVLLIDENARLGGSLDYARFAPDAAIGPSLRERLVGDIGRQEHAGRIEVMSGAVCNGWHADHWLAVIRGRRLYKVRAERTILCTGSLEQPAVFRNNDLPGVMLASAAQRLMRLYGVRPGSEAVVLTANADGYGAALDLADAGIAVRAIVDLNGEPGADSSLADFTLVRAELIRAALDRGIPVKRGWTVYEAHGTKHLESVELRPVTGQGICGETAERIDCDLLCTSVGYMPAYQLACQGGASLAYDDDTAAFTLTGLPPGMHLAGSIDGAWDLEAVRQLAERAALSACQGLSGDNPDRDSGRPPRQAAGDSGRSEGAGASLPGANHPWPIFPHPRGKEFVDLDEDLQIADLVNATKDGFEDIQLVKRYSTCGMGPSQGRQSALAAARIVARATGKSVAQTGVTTARPPYAGERIAHNARRNFFPVRHTSMHHRHAEAGAQMLQAGLWLRPAWYGPPDSGDACIAAEVDAVRNAVGVVDVSTLGGIEVRGPDAGEFLDRLYTWNFASQPVGRARYALLCNEAGMVIDDGVACRLHERHYYVTATTGGVDRVYRSMLRWNAQWRLDVDIANATSAWCGVNIAGPRAREVLAGLTDGIDLDRSAFPYMGVREGTVAGIDARVIRVGFVGELGYEVHVPQQCGEALWDAVMEAGEPSGIRPFGIEAQRVLRLEKGHVIIGQDTDAMTHPQEIGMGWALSDKKPFYVGQRTIRELGARPLSRQLAGFTMVSPSSDMPAESHLVVDGQRLVGRVTSCAMSPTLGRVVGLAYVPPESARPGEVIDIRLTGGRIVQANIVPMPFYDPDNERQKL